MISNGLADLVRLIPDFILGCIVLFHLLTISVHFCLEFPHYFHNVRLFCEMLHLVLHVSEVFLGCHLAEFFIEIGPLAIDFFEAIDTVV